MVILKKLANNKVHYSLPILYPAYIGIPTSCLISLVMFLTGAQKKDMQLVEDVPSILYQVSFAVASGLFGVLSQVFMNLSLKFEDTSKVSMVRSTDLLFTFLFQYLILRIHPNLFSTIGAFLILLATLFIIFLQMLEKLSLNEAAKNAKKDDITAWKNCLFFKI